MNLDRLAVLPQYLLPKQALTAAMGRFARSQAGAVTTAAVRAFIARYGVDMSEAAVSDPAAYRTFNAFFTRGLREGVRPLAATDWVCPVDGAVSRCGSIEDGRLLQAKGRDYTAVDLLGGDGALASDLNRGRFATLYLSPRDYHRIHMPRTGVLRRMRYVPGALFSVNPVTARGVHGLFARNERVVCHFVDDASGDFAMVLVGATIVGSIETVWHGVVNPTRPAEVRTWDYGDAGVRLEKGAEMGRFSLGSTVILLMPAGAGTFPAHWQPGATVRLGEPMLD
jgi:phosphatidylserine decarboxylase